MCLQMHWAVAQGHSDVAELLVLRDIWQLLLRNESSDMTTSAAASHRAELILLAAQQQLCTAEPGTMQSTLDKQLILAIVEAAEERKLNVVSILLRMEALLESAAFFGQLQKFTQQLLLQLMDLCKTKECSRAVLCSFDGEVLAPDQPADPVMYARRNGNKGLIAHKQVRMKMTHMNMEVVVRSTNIIWHCT